jgi:uncharacterized protein
MRNKPLFMLVSVLLVSLLAACAPGLGAMGLAPASNVTLQETPPVQSPVNPLLRTINVSGTGQVMLTPDIAYINIGVTTEGEDAAQALDQNNERVQGVISALRAQGVAAEDIQTSFFNIYPSQNFDREGQPMDTRYVVNNTVFVTVRNLNNLGQLLNVVVTSGANTINGITFDLADRSEALSQARAQAVTNARDLAEELAIAAGLELGEIQTISTVTGFVPGPVFGRGAGEAMAADVPISTGQLTITADVNVVFQIQ